VHEALGDYTLWAMRNSGAKAQVSPTTKSWGLLVETIPTSLTEGGFFKMVRNAFTFD
jgi:hypothetical protein